MKVTSEQLLDLFGLKVGDRITNIKNKNGIEYEDCTLFVQILLLEKYYLRFDNGHFERFTFLLDKDFDVKYNIKELLDE